MSTFCPLCSSSKGNSIYLSGGGTGLLIDAGISFRELRSALESQGCAIEKINGILITHEHSDHIRGLKTLLKRTSIPLYASRGTLDYLLTNGYIPAHTDANECSGPTCIGAIEVTPFDTPHDAAHSLGYRFDMPDQRKIAVATDLGHVSDTVLDHLSGCDLVMLESNYDKAMLECSSYPYVLKRRIKSDFGHLSNDDCSATLLSLAKNGTTRLVLGHLSEQNNLPALAREVTKSVLEASRLKENLDYILAVAPARGASRSIVF